jgi:hypothetical protein
MADPALALQLSGVAGNYASAPDSAALSITADLDVRACLSLTDWTPAAITEVVAKWTTTSNQRSYELQVKTDGTLFLQWSNDGTASLNATSTVATGIADGSRAWIRATIDVDDGSGNRVVKFYTSTDSASTTSPTWTQLGSTVTTAGTTAIFDSTSPLELGSRLLGTANQMAGNLYRAQIRSNIADNGTGIVFDASFTGVSVTASQAPTTFTEGSVNAATVTVNGPKGWFWVSPAALQLPGVSGNYASAPDSAALSITGDLDIRVLCSQVDWTPTAETGLIGKWTTTGNLRSYLVALQTAGGVRFYGSSNGTESISVLSSVVLPSSDGVALWVRATFRTSDKRVQFFTASASVSNPTSSDWTQLGVDRTIATAANTLADTTAVVGIGAFTNGTGGPSNGSFYRGQIRNNILDDGTGIVFDEIFSSVAFTSSRSPSSLTESSSNAATVTINGPAPWQWLRNVTATLAAPLGGLTATAAATPKVTAVLAATLGSLSATTTATPKVLATAAAPLGALTATATATPTVVATATAPLGSLNATAAATPKVIATATAPLGGLSATATAAVTEPATATAALGSLTATATATVTSGSATITATAAAPLGVLAATAVATVTEPVTASAPLGALSATAAATVRHTATASAPLGSLSASAAGLVTVPATAASLLGSLQAVAVAQVQVSATAQALLGGLSARYIQPVYVRYFDSTASTGYRDATTTAGHHDGRLTGSSADDSTATGSHHDGVLTAVGRREGTGP